MANKHKQELVKSGNLETVRTIVNNDRNLVHAKDDFGFTALHFNSKMYEFMLRHMFGLWRYTADAKCPAAFKAMKLTRDEWRQLAEFEAVMRPTHELSMDLQTDAVGAIAIAACHLMVAFCCDALKTAKLVGFEVVETRGDFITA